MDVILFTPEGKISIELIGISAVETEPEASIVGDISVGERVSPMSEAAGVINANGIGLGCCVGSNRPIENPFALR